MDPEWRQWLTRLWRDDRPALVRLLVVGAVGVGLVAWGTWGSRPAPSARSPLPSAAATALDVGPLGTEEAALADEVQKIVAAIPGAGAVHVAVTLAKSATTEYVSGRSTPLDEVSPAVAGVVVVATGAQSPRVREEIIEAVETLLQIQPYQVVVLPNGGGE
jgi:stage III sporulation protein AG